MTAEMLGGSCHGPRPMTTQALVAERCSNQPRVCVNMFNSYQQHKQTAGINRQMLTRRKKEDKNVICAKVSDWEIHNNGEIYY